MIPTCNYNDVKNTKDLVVDNLDIKYKDCIVLNNSKLKIISGKKYGLVGRNGIGKTTLMKCIGNKIINFPQDTDIIFVEQEVDSSDLTPLDVLIKTNEKLYEYIEKEKKMFNDDCDNDNFEDDMEELESMLCMNPSKELLLIRKILTGIGLTEKMINTGTKYLSGGFKMRVAISKALYMKPSFMILDEPTNHLDIDSSKFLTEYLNNWKGTLLFSSHDINFLNNVCTDIIHIIDKQLNYYTGNYYSFKKQLKNKEREKEKKDKKEKKRGEKEYKVNFSFPMLCKFEGIIYTCNDMSFGYEHELLMNLNFGIYSDSRICLVGKNGCGKSTLIKLITGKLKPTNGKSVLNSKINISLYQQHFADELPMDKTAVEYLTDKYNVDYQAARNKLGKFGLEGQKHMIKINCLSGGQKSRLLLTGISFENSHIIILDEPTNNLDVESIESLTESINEFLGCVILVTHDIELIKNTGMEIWNVDSGSIKILESIEKL
jgi:ATP-binding cassette subfamily F protein 1